MEASSLNQGDLSITDYFTKLRVIWDELDDFRPDLACSCQNKCSCNVSSVITHRKKDHAMQFLRDLNDQYNNINDHVLLVEPIPTITTKKLFVVQQECQFNNSYLVANIKNVNLVTHNITITCSFCGKFGHNETVCFKKNGFPNQDRKGSKFGNNNRKICTYYNRTGHIVDICYKKHGYPPGYRSQYGKFSQANNTQEENSSDKD
ncbi:uncharacterized protein [Phaseolus vulgaris]|uniref:uncharacterized protein n=1 Tax=Phaseolus vulgaris TaxID=3885 RepID=UPI0035CB46EA